LNQTSQPSPDTDDDWDSKATEALEAARLMPAGKEKSEAMKRAGLLRKAADIHKPFPAAVRKVPLAEVSGTYAQGTFFDRKNARKLGVKPQPEVGKSGMSYVKI